jgi:diguanylate cyclase (GGDEF)-like protein
MRTLRTTLHSSFSIAAASSPTDEWIRKAAKSRDWWVFPNMALDVKTLFFLTIYIDTILGTLLLFVWTQSASPSALAWWGSAHLMRAASVVLYGLYGTIPDLVSIDLANAILLSSYAVTWNGARVFDGSRTRPGSLIAGAAIWIGLCLWPGFDTDPNLRALVSAFIVATYAWLCAYEFWRGRSERLVSRWPAIFILFAHGAIFLLRSPLPGMMNFPTDNHLFASAWLNVLGAESLLFPISIAFILMAMAKERAEMTHKNAAKLDPLTGLPNRRSFLQDAEQLRLIQVSRGHAIAVLMIDLDHFKSINDRYGHSIGDRVLEIFSSVARAHLRSFDLIGRLGGEEFAVVIADGRYDNAVAVAERIRSDFAAATAVVDGHPVAATASIGISLIRQPAEAVSLLGEADRALYRAKDCGRNRVEAADEPSSGRPDTAPAGVAAMDKRSAA